MRVRLGWAAAASLAGCQAIMSPPSAPRPHLEPPPLLGSAPSGSEPGCQQGLTAVAVAPATAGEVVVASATEPVAHPDDALLLAARCLDSGDEAGAVPHLESHVRRHPDQVMFRANLAEVLFRLGRHHEAREQFARFVADAQPLAGAPRKHLVHCHTRLMDLARESGDRFGESLHRGVGLYLLAADGQSSGSAADDGFREEMLCKAVRALREAKDLRPHDPRADVYLADALARAGSPAADGFRRVAAHAGPGELTAAEAERAAWAKGVIPVAR